MISPKVKTSRNPDYLRYVRSHSSCLSWDPPLVPWPDREDPLFDPASFGTVAHHVRLGGDGGMGLKPSDYRTVPLTDREHRRLHDGGERSFWAEAGLDPAEVMISLLAAYVRAGGQVLVCPERTYFSALERLAEEQRLPLVEEA